MSQKSSIKAVDEGKVDLRKRREGLIGVLRFLKPYPGQCAAAVGLLLANIAIEMSLPQWIGEALTRYRRVTGGLGGEGPEGLILLYLGLVALRMVLGMILGVIRNKLVQRVLADIRAAIFDAIQRLPFRYHDKVNTGELISRSVGDAWKLQDFLFACLFLLVDIVVALVLTVGLIFAVHWSLGLLAVATLVPTMTLIGWYAAQLQPKWREVHDLHGAMTTVIQENIAGVRVVKAFAREDGEIEKFRAKRDVFLSTLRTAIDYWAARVPLAQFLFGLSIPLALVVGGRLVIRDVIPIGDLAKVILYLMAVGHRLGAVGQFTNIVQNASAAAERILEVIQDSTRLQTGDQEPPGGASGGSRVTFEHVHFGYGDDREALKDVSFDAGAGETVAIVGPTGSGKTTLINLVTHFYDPSAGRVLVDGQDIRTLRLGGFRRMIGLVFQETFLFSATVADNIAYGRPDASREAVVRAAEAAQAHEFIIGLEKGYDTVVGERGVNLSGGQKQRLALARAFLIEPRILIMDDATASVDAKTEHLIQDAMKRVARGRTTFVISHRLSSVQWADRILVLDDGRLVASGTHESLWRDNAFYRGLFKEQAA